MKIPFHRPSITDEEIDAVVDSLRNRWITMGPKTIDFERRFASYIGAGHAVAVSSGTAAMHCVLAALGIGPGDEVLVPAITFVASAEVVEYCGARPVLVDVDRHTHCINPDRIQAAINPRTRAIIPVHYAGHACDMDAIMDSARRHGLVVIEDAAHSLPTRYRGRMVGAIGDFTCFSFYATKTLATGEGGMITTGDDQHAAALRSLRLHGMSRDAWKRYTDVLSWRYDVERLGYKYNTTDLNAALGIGQLARQDSMRERRAHIAARYTAAFASHDTLIPYVPAADCECAWHLYPLKLNLAALSIGRDGFFTMLYERGVSASVHFIPLYHFTYYKNKYSYTPQQFPDSEWIFERQISLPIYPDLADIEVDYIIDSVLDIAHGNRR